MPNAEHWLNFYTWDYMGVITFRRALLAVRFPTQHSVYHWGWISIYITTHDRCLTIHINDNIIVEFCLIRVIIGNWIFMTTTILATGFMCLKRKTRKSSKDGGANHSHITNILLRSWQQYLQYTSDPRLILKWSPVLNGWIRTGKIGL